MKIFKKIKDLEHALEIDNGLLRINETVKLTDLLKNKVPAFLTLERVEREIIANKQEVIGYTFHSKNCGIHVVWVVKESK